MADTHPGDTERLHEYWVHGEGAAKIRWGEPGDWQRCVDHLGKYISDAKGYCDLAHHSALGIWPAQHAEELKGRSGMVTTQRAELSTASINNLPDSDFAYIEPGGTKDASGRTTPRDLRHFPIHDAAHVRDALGRAPQSPFGDKAMPKIRKAAAKFGIDVSGDDSGSSSGRAESLGPYVRSFPLQDVSIRDDGDGRIVEAYAAVFNTPAEVRDQDGHYMEELDPVVFNRAIRDAAPQGNRKDWRVGVFYNHAMTIHGTPSELYSMPVGVPLDIKADGHGVRTVTRYHRGELGDMILERLAAGSLPGYSFTGHFRRSQPLIPRGGFRPDRSGSLPVVRRMESTFKEYGPTPFPVYSGAAVTAMRSDQMLAALAADPELAMRMLSMFRDGAHDSDSPPPSGAPAVGLATEDSRQLARSGRSAKEEMQARRSAFLQRQHRR